MDPSITYYEKVCQGLRSFYVCVIEEEDLNGEIGLLAHETPLRHARFEDAKKRQNDSARNSKTWIAKCTLMPETEKEQDPVTVAELATLFQELREHPESSFRKRALKQRMIAWLKQEEDSLSF